MSDIDTEAADSLKELDPKRPIKKRTCRDSDLLSRARSRPTWQSFNIQHELTRKEIEKFVADYRATLSQTT